MAASPWGPDDEIGRLNWMTPQTQAEALAAADGSQAFDLAVPYFLGMPSWIELGDPKYDIWLTHSPQAEGHAYSGTAITMYTHVGTHICSLNHIGTQDGFWNGWSGDTHLGSRCWRVGGIYPPVIARAVLLDVARTRGVDCLEDSYAISADDLVEAGGSEVRRGDIVLVRTGRMTAWPDHDAFMRTPPGLSLGAARWLAEEAQAMCVGVDAGGEALPPKEGGFLPVHGYLLAKAGMPIFEYVWLEDLAASGIRTCTFCAFPLKLQGSTGLPVRPIAFVRRDAGRV